MAGKTIHLQGKDGKLKGSRSLEGKTPPTGSDTLPSTLTAAGDAPAPAYDGMYSTFCAETPPTQAPDMPKSTGKQGTDIPPLVVEIPGGGRYYVAHPDDRALAVADIDRALAEGKAFPSVTTCLGAFDKPPLMNWATGLVADAGEDRLRTLDAADPAERDALLASWLAPEPARGRISVFKKDVLASYKNKKDESAGRGTDVHAIVEALSHGETPDIPADLTGYVNGYRAFRAEYPDMTFLYTEATIVNEEDGSMGTADAIVQLNGKNYILDWKTNKDATVYQTTGMQLAAGANGTAIVYPDGRRDALPPIHGGIGVGLNPDGKHGVFFFETARGGPNHDGFRAAVNAWRWQRAHSARSVRSTREDIARFSA